MQAMGQTDVGIMWTNTLRAWREFRGLTQEELGEKAGTSGSVISLLEAGKRQLTPKWLRRLAEILHVEPGYLLDHNPNDLPVDLLDIWADIPEERRAQAISVLRTFSTPGRTT
jgi:transcriptional regulator with XRE-family HTH domain